MSENSPEPDEYQPEDDGDKRVYIKRANLKALEEKARVGETSRRELAFYRAGINMSDPKLTYFVKGYDGELDPDAIRAAAQDAGFIERPALSEAEQQAQASAQAADRVASAATNTAPPPASQADRQREYAEALATGGPQALAALAAKYGPVVGRNIL